MSRLGICLWLFAALLGCGVAAAEGDATTSAAPAARETDEDGRLESLPDDPVRTGHSFTGWFTAKENGQKVTTAYQ